ncbi:L-ascorbate metabolism protein UlaG (beta-lactamase superfamily) [Nocardia transvalensis]|uniref:L-ascorbate metabolism protein UlaG (Beta-lactamase superfamily) n=1 Tax=Nocardia transvalensis TaxID=37333 RepID=A0A7W9PLF4_9NOCA|nr:MBL fold metallo-hydrolase [Nocardia transvalensis]MBB5918192.1 L-ascorbate metabolism protein UlaG (beta-lactamase superfamily) [Nocardia transvalensis]
MTNTISTTVDLLHIGGPTVRFRYGALTWLTDPTFDAPGDYTGPVPLHKLTGPAVPADRVGPVDVVLLSHDQHADNLDNAGRAFLAGVEHVLSTTEAAGRMEGVRGLANWESVRIGPVTVTGVPALHGPERAEALSGPVTGFVLRADGLPTVYVSGDNASVEYVERIVSRLGPIDVALLNVGAANVGRFGDIDVTLNARTAVAAAAALGDAVIVPVHAEGWAHFTETLDHLRRTFAYGGREAQLRIPPLGTEFSV